MDKEMDQKLPAEVEKGSGIWSKLTCEVHPDQQFLYISIDPSLELVFKCADCIADRQVDSKTLIPIHQILNPGKTTIFSNFPTSDFDLTTKFRESFKLALTYEEYMENIEATFKIIQSQIIDTLEKSKQKMKQIALEMSTNDVFNQTYMKLCEMQKLRDILLNQETSITEKSTELQTIFTDLSQKETDNKFEMTKLFHKYTFQQEKLNPKNQLMTKEMIWNTYASDKILSFLEIPRVISCFPIYFKNQKQPSSHYYGQSTITYNNNETIISAKKLSFSSLVNTKKLNNENGYMIKLNFSHPLGSPELKNQIQIGFIYKSQFINTEFSSKFYERSLEIVKGSNLCSDPLCQVTKQLEIRWCLKKSQIFFADSKYENINKVTERIILSTGQHRFAIQLMKEVSEDSNVSISDFCEINPDDVSYFE